jgi:hypothetical protein
MYVGKHQTTNLDDGYMGSGKILRDAIKLYGVENFHKEILFVFDNEAEMNRTEAEIVTEEFILRDDTYNLCVGGQGGFSHINKVGLNNSSAQRSKAKELTVKRNQNGSGRSDQFKEKVSNTLRGRKLSDGMLNKKHREETRQKMSESHGGSKNSQFGSFWITNGVENRKLSNADVIPTGWQRGRKLK